MPTKASPATIRTVPMIAGKSLIVIASSSLPPLSLLRPHAACDASHMQYGKEPPLAILSLVGPRMGAGGIRMVGTSLDSIQQGTS
jgi:hypothetical protein